MACPLTPEELHSARCALAQAYCRFASRLRRWVSRHLNGAAAHVGAEDVVQEAFCRTWERICRGEFAQELWDSELRFYRWLCGICHRILHEAHRHVVYPLPALAEEPELQELSERPSAVPPPVYPEALCSASAEEHLQSLERERLLERLQAEVFQLPEPYRTVLLLRYWERRQWSYIVGQLHVSRQTLHRWHTHALQLLRCKLHAFWNG